MRKEQLKREGRTKPRGDTYRMLKRFWGKETLGELIRAAVNGKEHGAEETQGANGKKDEGT